MKDHKKRLQEAKPLLLPPAEPRISPRAGSPSKITEEIKPGLTTPPLHESLAHTLIIA
jgi:hypothetical protein